MKKVVLALSALLVAGHLCAEDKGLNYGLKMRVQTGFQTVDGVRNGFGFGGYVALPVGPGEITAELGYQYYAGRQYRESIGANPFGLHGDDTDDTPAGTANAFDSRKNSIDGLSARVSYGQLFSENWGWHLGAAVAKLKSHHESLAGFGQNSSYGGWDCAVEKSAISVSPFVGVTFKTEDKGFLELNVLLASYKQATVEPSYNAGATGFNRVTRVVGDKNVNKPKFEICYGFRF